MKGISEVPDDLPDFSGKVISMDLIDDESDRDLIEARFTMQAGRVFLVGVVPEGASASGWSDGAGGAVAWDRVVSYLLFDSLEAYHAAIRRSREADEGDRKPA